MGNTERFTVELPEEVAKRLRARVTAGDFPSESAVIVAALLLYEGEDNPDPDPVFEAWLRGPVADAYDEVSAGTAQLYTPEELRQRLRFLR